jgi:hypothetical protein
MIGLRLAGLVLCVAGGTAYAQSATENSVGLQSCVQAARLADSICAKLPIAQPAREDCLKKAGTALLKCLEQVLPEGSVEAPEAAHPAPPKSSSALSSPKQPGRTDSLEAARSGAPADAIAEKPKAPASEANVIPPPAETPLARRVPEAPGKRDDLPARKADWTLSETRSPVDFSPLVTAITHATSDVKDGAASFEIRCRSQHIEISIRAGGVWKALRGNELVVEYQINGQPMVRQPWILSVDGKTATYRNDSVELLRSLPDGATMKIALTDKGGVRHESSFDLTGVSRVRESVGTACKLAPMTAKTLLDRR